MALTSIVSIRICILYVVFLSNVRQDILYDSQKDFAFVNISQAWTGLCLYEEQLEPHNWFQMTDVQLMSLKFDASVSFK
jgi:hypothetical protein